MLCRHGVFIPTDPDTTGRPPDAAATLLLLSPLFSLPAAAIAVPINTAFGIAAALLIARSNFRGKSLMLTVLDLPFSISPVVTGLMLVLLYGRGGWFAPLLEVTPLSPDKAPQPQPRLWPLPHDLRGTVSPMPRQPRRHTHDWCNGCQGAPGQRWAIPIRPRQPCGPGATPSTLVPHAEV